MSFSDIGLAKLGAEKFNDDVFNGGLDPQQDWVPEFKPSGGGIDGVLIVFNFGNDKQSIEKVYTKTGTVYENHLEHCGLSFRWMDGISQPIVKGFDDISKQSIGKGITPIDPGVIIIGNEGDKSMPEWAKDGSFMVFRIYQQLVPEFYHWCAMNCPTGVKDTKALE
ncbi:hypothetical protein PENNAL_c0024G03165 [Penicillium nalgiovense]|uniref:Uncharacterized protein n=1 Tax=Penicillium nalgiovense TaxID=60175 RepID=A0A1V6YD23_PENNA|nr:hypothetical protein PENNAL_c0024G03165 [Penicillium nalgiovense]